MKGPVGASLLAMAVAIGRMSLVVGSTSAVGQEAVPVNSLERTWTIPSNDEIRKLLAARMQHNGVGAVVGVIEPAGQRVVAYGKSGASNGLDGDTVFQIGSVTKAFTALLLADMVRRGEVKLDDPASNHLPPGVRMPQRGRPITLLDLATHRSGLPSMPTNFALQAQPNPIEAYAAEDLHRFLSSYTPDLEPGAKGVYSNLAVALLGRLLASRAGMEYESLLKERILNPLGMKSSSITLTPDQTARLAPGHDRYLRPVDSWEMRTLQGSGSLRSTANDMLLFLAANLGYRDTPLKTSMEYQRTVRSPMNPARALAWGAVKVRNEECFGHEGGKAGYRSAVNFCPKSRIGIVVLMNARTDDRPTALAMHLLMGEPLPPAPPAPLQRKMLTLSSKRLESYAGQYQLQPSKFITIVKRADHLLVDVDRDGGNEAFPFTERDFFFNTEPGGVTFEVDTAGQVTGLRIHADDAQSGNYESASRIGSAQ